NLLNNFNLKLNSNLDLIDLFKLPKYIYSLNKSRKDNLTIKNILNNSLGSFESILNGDFGFFKEKNSEIDNSITENNFSFAAYFMLYFIRILFSIIPVINLGNSLIYDFSQVNI